MKKIIFAFILGAVIFSTITAIAVTQINANQITYTKNGTDTTVDAALNDLYTEANKDILTRLNLSSSKITTNDSYGFRIPNRSTTLDLTTGSYLVVVAYHDTGGVTGTSNVSNNSNIISLSYNNGSCTRLSGRRLFNYISPFGGNANLNYVSYEAIAIYSCKFTQNLTLNISSNDAPSENEGQESHIMAQAIKLD